MRKINYAQALNEALREEMQRDQSVVLLGEDIGVQGGNFAITRGLREEFGPERVKDTPISEAAIISLSLGAALCGMRPVPEIMFSSFLGCCMDELCNEAALIRYMSGGQVSVPIVVRTVNVLGRSSAAQHSGRPESWFVHTPGLKVVVPSTPYDAKGLLKTAIRDDDPVMFFEHCFLYYGDKQPVPETDYTIPFGVADIKRDGRDVTIVAYSMMVKKALQAAEILAEEGIEAEVVDPRTLVPFDVETVVNSVKKTQRVIVASEDCKRAGMGTDIASTIMEEAFFYLDAPSAIVAAADVPAPFSPVLEKEILPDVDDIVAAARQMLS